MHRFVSVIIVSVPEHIVSWGATNIARTRATGKK